MVIRREQMAAFEESAINRANLALARYARERFPQQFLVTPEEKLVGIVGDIRKRAAAHGVTEEADVATAVDLSVMYEPEFYSLEWSRDVFAVGDWNGSQKMAVLRERVRRQVHDF